MTEAYSANSTGGGSSDDKGGAAVLATAHGLSLAAAPTFAIMALLTVGIGGGQTDLLCGDVHHASPLTGMALMYVLMSAFHSAPWLKLISGRAKKLEGN